MSDRKTPRYASDLMAGQVALVTGSGSGMGRATALEMASCGARLALFARREEPLEETAEMIRTAGGEAFVVPGDTRDEDSIETAMGRIKEHYGQLDVLVNNAGGAPEAEAATVSPRFSDKILALNLNAALHFSQAANAVMQNQDAGGSITHISSVSGMRSSPGTAAYGAAKAGLISLAQSLAVEWAPKVRVNAVAAGMILTELADMHYGDADSIARISKTVPLERLGEPRDIGDVCLFLASPLARYVTGANLLVHGGGERPAFKEANEND